MTPFPVQSDLQNDLQGRTRCVCPHLSSLLHACLPLDSRSIDALADQCADEALPSVLPLSIGGGHDNLFRCRDEPVLSGQADAVDAAGLHEREQTSHSTQSRSEATDAAAQQPESRNSIL